MATTIPMQSLHGFRVQSLGLRVGRRMVARPLHRLPQQFSRIKVQYGPDAASQEQPQPQPRLLHHDMELQIATLKLEAKMAALATKEDLKEWKQELKEDIKQLKTELKEGIKQLKTELKQDIKQLTTVLSLVVLFLVATNPDFFVKVQGWFK